MIRLGLCCIFRKQPIRFRQTTAAHLLKYDRPTQLSSLSRLCCANLMSLKDALHWLASHHIGAFRVLSPLFPRYTHPGVGYRLEELPDCDKILELCVDIRHFHSSHNIRLSLHPDQFNVLSSPHDHVVANTVAELEYQAMLAELIGAEVINIHGGGVYGNKKEALQRFERNFALLSQRVRDRLTIENDDRCYCPEDLLPLCRTLFIPFVYDVHHHRCLKDGLSEEEATAQCIKTWQKTGREPYFHLSSPKDGWHAVNCRPHADYINPADFPQFWRDLEATVDVEAKAKELAVLRLRQELAPNL